ncbi:MAG: nitroreductase family protein [Tannerella sp.]|jgi:nitroreductase|nr:nitroreductase family protein [Tannerella sp.]
MENFTSLILNRRSTRRFDGRPISPEQVECILKAALMAPSSKSARSWQFVAVEDKNMLKQLAGCKKAGSAFVEHCAVAIVVTGDTAATDVWIEDAAVASAYIQLQAEDLGLGSCWCQVRNRLTGEAADAEQHVRDLLGIPSGFGVLSIIGIGHKDQVRKPVDESQLPWEKVHVGSW